MSRADWVEAFIAGLADLERSGLAATHARLQAVLEAARGRGAPDPFAEDVRVSVLPYSLQEQLVRILSVSPDVENGLRDDLGVAAALSGRAGGSGFGGGVGSSDVAGGSAGGGGSSDDVPGATAFAVADTGGAGLLASVTLTVAPPFPSSLVITPRAVAKYQLLFRHLLALQAAVRAVGSVWGSQCVTRRLMGGSGSGTGSDRTAWGLTQRMSHMATNLLHYLTFEVIEPNWALLAAGVAAAGSVDAVTAAHEAFLDACLQEGLLTDRAVSGTISALLSVCGVYAAYVERFARALTDESTFATPAPGTAQERLARREVQARHVRDLMERGDYLRAIEGFAENFDGYAGKLGRGRESLLWFYFLVFVCFFLTCVHDDPLS
jgi:hypothetical protein